VKVTSFSGQACKLKGCNDLQQELQEIVLDKTEVDGKGEEDCGLLQDLAEEPLKVVREDLREQEVFCSIVSIVLPEERQQTPKAVLKGELKPMQTLSSCWNRSSSEEAEERMIFHVFY
jgi:hypothetical protein